MFNCVYYCTYITGKNLPGNVHLLLNKTARSQFPDCMLDSLRPFRVRFPGLSLVTVTEPCLPITVFHHLAFIYTVGFEQFTIKKKKK